MRVELREMVFRIFCDCGKEFRAEAYAREDFEPECPYCDRKYAISVVGSTEEVRVEIKPT